MSIISTRRKIIAWTRLVRLPNLFTLPGDVLVGYFFTGQDQPVVLGCLILISLFLYSSGILLNDLCDIEEDRSWRLPRPLVTGEVQPRHAIIALAMLLCLAILFSLSGGLSTIATVIVLVCLIFFYNMKARRWKYAGFAVMGSIRVGNILLGASPVLYLVPIELTAIAFLEAAYVFFICLTAYGERGSSVRPVLVSMLIKGLVPLQVLFLIAGGFITPALAVACVIPISFILSRQGYYAT